MDGRQIILVLAISIVAFIPLIMHIIYEYTKGKAIHAELDELSKDFMLKAHKSIDTDKKYCSRCGKEHYACYMYSINWSDELYCKYCIEGLRKEYTDGLNSANCDKYLDVLRQLP